MWMWFYTDEGEKTYKGGRDRTDDFLLIVGSIGRCVSRKVNEESWHFMPIYHPPEDPSVVEITRAEHRMDSPCVDSRYCSLEVCFS